jgi:hypothetical protein
MIVFLLTSVEPFWKYRSVNHLCHYLKCQLFHSTWVESTTLSLPLNALLEAVVACGHLNRWGQSQIKHTPFSKCEVKISVRV